MPEREGTPWEPYVIELNAPEGIGEIEHPESGEECRKVIEDESVIIIRNGVKYDMIGRKKAIIRKKKPVFLNNT